MIPSICGIICRHPGDSVNIFHRENKYCFIMGDLDLDLLKYESRTTTTTQSLIDIIATNNPEIIKTANVIPLSID